MEKVAVLKCSSYEVSEMDECINKLFSLLGVDDGRIDFAGKNVVIKANLVSAINPTKCATTHPSVIEAVVRFVQTRGGKCVIADSSGGPFNGAYMGAVYKATEMSKVAERTGATLNADFGYTNVENKGAVTHKTLPLINVLNNADYIINVGKLKTHTFMGYSGAVKNMFGAIPGLVKVEMHGNFKDQYSFANYLVDIFETLKSKICLNVIDGVQGMEGEGPTGGTPITVNCMLASCNAYALDLVMQNIMGVNPSQMPLVSVELERGLISGCDLSGMELVGDDVNEFAKINFDNPQIEIYSKSNKKVPLFLNGFVHRVMTKRPAIPKSKCKGCKKCYNHCPVKAIEMQNRKDEKLYAKVDYDKCIRCFCCQELCPFNVVKIKSGFVYKIVHRKRKNKSTK